MSIDSKTVRSNSIFKSVSLIMVLDLIIGYFRSRHPTSTPKKKNKSIWVTLFWGLQTHPSEEKKKVLPLIFEMYPSKLYSFFVLRGVNL